MRDESFLKILIEIHMGNGDYFKLDNLSVPQVLSEPLGIITPLVTSSRILIVI